VRVVLSVGILTLLASCTTTLILLGSYGIYRAVAVESQKEWLVELIAFCCAAALVIWKQQRFHSRVASVLGRTD